MAGHCHRAHALRHRHHGLARAPHRLGPRLRCVAGLRGAFFPEDDAHAFIEFGNRVFGIFPITFSILTAWAARHLPRWTFWTAVGVAVLTVAEAPLGLATIRYDLPPEIVMVHFLVALLALAGARRPRRGDPCGARRSLARVPARAADRSRRPRGCLPGLVLTGTLVTSAGPHSGDPDVIHRLWNLPDALYVHVRVTAVFGCVFLFVLGYIVARRSLAPRLFRLRSCCSPCCSRRWRSASSSGA